MTRPSWLTESAWEAIWLAKRIALSEEASTVAVRHVIQALAGTAETLVAGTLAALGCDARRSRTLLKGLQPAAGLPEGASVALPLEQGLVDHAKALAQEYPAGHKPIVAPAHLWAAVAASAPALAVWLGERGWTDEEIAGAGDASRVELAKLHPKAAPPDPGLTALRSFCSRDLTALAIEGRLKPALEVDPIRTRIVRGLLRMNRRSLVLTGPPGVGKTKLIEDLAVRIASGEIPELKGCEVLELDLALFLRGTQYRGSVAERWSQLTEALRAHAERIILFIDELHTIIGLPIEGQAMTMANALKPLLVDDRVRIIGATTPEEYRRHIEGDRALARRFTDIQIPEPDRETTIAILRGIAPRFEDYYKVRFVDDALVRIYESAQIHLPNESFPSKAVDLLDELGVRAQTAARSDSKGDNREIVTVRGNDVRDAFREKFNEGDGVPPSELASYIKQRVIGQDAAADVLAEIVLRSAYRYSSETRRGPRGVVVFVGPPGVGKTYTAQVLAEALRPGGGGLLTLDMTEFGGAHAGEHARWRLIGPPAPYVGWEAGGILTNHALRNPTSVVLVDEFDKADPEARNILLRVFDEGMIQDGRGRLVSFRNTYFILTSNQVGQRRIGIGLGPNDRDDAADAARSDAMLRSRLAGVGLSPELLSRVSSIVRFGALGAKDLRKIAAHMLRDLKQAALWEDAVLLRYDSNALSGWLLKQASGPLDCRRLRDEFERRIEMPLVRWRAVAGEHQTILRLEPGSNEVELLRETPEPREGAIRDLAGPLAAGLTRGGRPKSPNR